MSIVVNHLLFDKAMIGVDTERIDQYIGLAGDASSAAEIATSEAPFTRSVTLLFILVKEHELDPWSLDIKHLITEYQKYAVNSDDFLFYYLQWSYQNKTCYLNLEKLLLFQN